MMQLNYLVALAPLLVKHGELIHGHPKREITTDLLHSNTNKQRNQITDMIISV